MLPFHQLPDLPTDLFLSIFTSHILYTHLYVLCCAYCRALVTSSYPFFITVTRQRMYYVKRNIEVRSRNHCCPGKPIRTEYYECVCLYYCLSYPASKSHSFSVVLYCHLWPVRFHYIFPNYLTNGTIFMKSPSSSSSYSTTTTTTTTTTSATTTATATTTTTTTSLLLLLLLLLLLFVLFFLDGTTGQLRPAPT